MPNMFYHLTYQHDSHPGGKPFSFSFILPDKYVSAKSRFKCAGFFFFIKTLKLERQLYTSIMSDLTVASQRRSKAVTSRGNRLQRALTEERLSR